jgi:putative ABC transport system ATP-binding protein
MSHLIEATGIHKKFSIGLSSIHVLKGIDSYIEKGEFVAIMGPSGSGKSTLLYILGCLDRPTSGTYLLEGKDVFQASDRELSRLRADQIGFVFQTFNLLPHLSLLENVGLPFLYSSLDDKEAKDRIMSAIQRVSLLDRLTHRPTELSGGEMQRVAIARALAVEPDLILADEPTGNLDSQTSLEILKLFQGLNEGGSTIVMVTHDREVASYAQRVLILKDGKFI